MKFFCTTGIFMLFFHIALADVKPNSLFSDHMVLQMGVPVPVWGTGDEGEAVTVRFNGQQVTSKTVNGKWKILLSPMEYVKTPTAMTISGKNTLVINDVLVGEVWVCSGQSNMERQLGPRPPQPMITNWERERDLAAYPLIRQFYVPLNYAVDEIDDVESKWTVCSPNTVSDFSAVAYFMAKNLHKKLNVPIGIVFSAFGGTPAEDWMSKQALTAHPDLKEVVENYDKDTSGYRPEGKVMNGLYNGMIHPLLPLAVKGCAWYQGESNNKKPEQYRTLLTAMIHNWRSDFGNPEMPFLIVQIAPHKDMKPELREAQLLVSQAVKNTALIVTTDCGDANDIHPPFKQPVGARLALAARGLAYGEQMEYQGPVYKSVQVKGKEMIVEFDHVGKGLSTQGSSLLTGFTIAGKDKIFVPATAKIKGKTIVVSNDTITQPVAVRYGWSNVPDVNLYNADGLPASPFRTDVE
jgi:sialate O-acetylesterase